MQRYEDVTVEVPDAASGSALGTPSLTRSALGGVVWNWAGSGVLIVAQIASTAATARLVAPREFGLYATAQAAASLTGYFTMAAIGPALQRRTRLGEKTVGTALTLSLTASLLVALALWLGASLWARAWNVPDAAAIVRIFAIFLFLTSAATVPVALLRRRLQFGKAAILETSSLVVALASGVGLAIALHSALALAIGQAVGAATLLVAAGVAARRELRFCFDSADARELFKFASQVGGLSLFTYASITLPTWFTARVFGPYILGLYSRANLIVALPAHHATSSILKVIFPLYGRVRNDSGRTKTLLDEALTLTTGLIWPIFALIAGASPVIISVLLGPRWDAAAALLPLFALAACGYVPSWLLSNAAEAFGWMRMIAARQTAFLVGVAATLATVYFASLSLAWLLVGVAASQWAAYALTLRPFIRRRFLDKASVLRKQLVHATIAGAAFGAAATCAEIFEESALTVQVASQVAVGTTVVVTIILGRSWIPATQVLARRVGAGPDESIVRAGLAALR
jgi:O-antigen/teichoic acid export membrane protein